MGVIYTATNLVNGKVYVGKTMVGGQDRWRSHKSQARQGSQTYFHRSIRKHGEDNFQFKVIDFALLQEELDEKEMGWIALFQTTNPEKGYNCTVGADGKVHTAASRTHMKGRKMSPETIAKLRAANLGRKKTPEQCAAIGNSKRGRRATEEQRRKRSEDQKRRYAEKPWPMPKPSAAGRKRISDAAKARLSSPEARAERSERQRRYYANHPEERAKIGAFHRERYLQKPWKKPEVTAESRQKMADAAKRWWAENPNALKRRVGTEAA